jgi:hypothetical protein
VSNCTQCGAQVAPNSRFCTECGRPVAAAGPAPVPPMHPGMVPPVPPVAQPGAFPPPPPPGHMGTPFPPVAPIAQPGRVAPPPAMQPQMAPPPVPQQPAAAPAAPAPQAPAANPNAIRMSTAGDLFNNGNPMAIIVTGSQLVLMPAGGAPMVDNIPGLRHAVVGDFDGDGTVDLALFTDSHVWIVRYSHLGGVPSGKVPLAEVPEHLVAAPFKHDGRTVLMSTTAEKITFYVLHPSRGLVEVGATTVPAIE